MHHDRESLINSAILLRKEGQSHRDISKKLNIGLGTAVDYCKSVKLTKTQHIALKVRGGLFKRPYSERRMWTSKGSKNWLARLKYDENQLIQLIQKFYNDNGRIPLKRELNTVWQPIKRIFGSWNNAICKSGYHPNRVKFSRRYIALDGHKCDSYSEKIIDDFLSVNKINHETHVYYPGQKKFKCDFLINENIWIEFVGLKGFRSYDKCLSNKREFLRHHNIKTIELYPEDIFPKIKLPPCVFL